MTIHAHVCTCVYTHIHAYNTHMYIYIHIHTYIRTGMDACMHEYARTHVRTYVDVQNMAKPTRSQENLALLGLLALARHGPAKRKTANHAHFSLKYLGIDSACRVSRKVEY
jgi:hypothetical protein